MNNFIPAIELLGPLSMRSAPGTVEYDGELMSVLKFSTDELGESALLISYSVPNRVIDNPE